MGMRMVEGAGWLTFEQQPPNMKASMTTTATRDGPVWRSICTGTALGPRASPSVTALPLPSRCRELPMLAGENSASRSQGWGLELSCRRQRDPGARTVDPRAWNEYPGSGNIFSVGNGVLRRVGVRPEFASSAATYVVYLLGTGR